jgi:hypothetical protein
VRVKQVHVGAGLVELLEEDTTTKLGDVDVMITRVFEELIDDDASGELVEELEKVVVESVLLGTVEAMVEEIAELDASELEEDEIVVEKACVLETNDDCVLETDVDESVVDEMCVLEIEDDSVLVIDVDLVFIEEADFCKKELLREAELFRDEEELDAELHKPYPT